MKRLFKKAFRDLFSNRKKITIAIIAIIIGMVAFGSLLFSHQMIINQIQTTYPQINPSSAIIGVNKVDSELEEITKDNENISDYTPKAYYNMRGQNSKNEWSTLEVYAAKDFDKLTMNKPFHIDGKTNPGLGEMLIERDAIGVAGKQIGDSILVQLPNGSQKTLEIVGVINDLSVHPASIHKTVYAYVNFDTLDQMGLAANRIEIMTKGDPFDRHNILEISNDYISELEQNGYIAGKLEVSKTPGVSMHLSEYKTVLFLLRTFSFVAFLFGCMIIGNLLTAIMSKQIKQIGILKSIGAKTKDILSAYLLSIFAFVLIIVLVSIPLSSLLAKVISTPLLRISNMSLENTFVSPFLYFVFISLALVVPMVIAYFPIRKGIRISIKDALNECGNTNESINSPKIFKLSKNISRPVLLSLRNSVRKKGRFALNLSTLAISGICFVVVLVTMLSVSSTIQNNIKQIDFDYHIITKQVSQEQLKDTMSKSLEIISYESWGNTSGKVVAENGQATDSYLINAPVNNSHRIQPQIVAGRWLEEKDDLSVVVGHGYVNDYPETNIGEKIVLNIGGKQSEFKIVGILRDFQPTTIYMNKSTYEEVVPDQAKSDLVKISVKTDAKGMQRMQFFENMEKSIQSNGLSILHSETKEDLADVVGGHYTITFLTFFIVIIMIAVVSAFGLASTMNLQTLERTKEIGIMKAMGGNKKRIYKIITAESKFIAIVSWLVTLALGLPAVFIGLWYFGNNIIEAPIKLKAVALVIAYIVWLVMILIIGSLASKRPAKIAAKMTIKNALESD